MPPDAELIYFDASVFIAWFNNEPGRAETIERILSASFDGALEIVTSIVSLTEVAYYRTDGAQIDQAQLDRQINALLLNERLIRVVEFERRVALRARHLVRAGSGNRRGLTVLDAIHLASAEIAGCNFFATYDQDFGQATEEVAMTIGRPTLEFSS